MIFSSRESLDKMSTKEEQTNQLLDMGFGNNRVVRALQATGFKVGHIRKYFQFKILTQFVIVRGWSRQWNGCWPMLMTPLWMSLLLRRKGSR